MKIEFPAINIPALKIPQGFFLNAALFGIGLIIPPIDIVLIPAIKLTEPIVLFDSDVLIAELTAPLFRVAESVWDVFEGRLDSMAEAYYKAEEED